MSLHIGDCLDILPGIADASVDAVVTDPPYGLEFMGREWDSFKPSQARIRRRTDGRTNPAEGKSVTVTPESYTAGQPFQAWCEKWAAECLRVLKPGGHLLAFGGTRTYHRLACGIEDAGFEIRDSLHWLYGSGFPKSKACLKPAHEPIVLARKPAGRMVPLNIDGCRVGISATDDIHGKNPHTRGGFGHAGAQIYTTNGDLAPAYDPSAGRWPPNVLLDPEAAGELDRQSGVLAGCGSPKRTDSGRTSMFGIGQPGQTYEREGGGASRFFPVFRYQAKASSRERPRLPDGTAHPTVKPVDLMRWLVRLVTPPGGLVLDPFAGSGTTGEAAILEGFRYLLIEKDPASAELIRQRLSRPLQPGLIT